MQPCTLYFSCAFLTRACVLWCRCLAVPLSGQTRTAIHLTSASGLAVSWPARCCMSNAWGAHIPSTSSFTTTPRFQRQRFFPPAQLFRCGDAAQLHRATLPDASWRCLSLQDSHEQCPLSVGKIHMNNVVYHWQPVIHVNNGPSTLESLPLNPLSIPVQQHFEGVSSAARHRHAGQ
jgi:hypothetical protein